MRRLIGILLAAVTPALVLVSFFVDTRLFDGRHPIPGYVCLLLGLLVAATNVYFSFLRARLIRWRSGAAPLRHVSGIPLFGAIVLPGLALLPPSALISALAAVQVLCDTHSITWFVIATWSDTSLWSPKTTPPSPR